MSYNFGNNANPLPPAPQPPMMPGMQMMGQSFESMHNYNMNPGMMMAAMNDNPLEFNMNKNIPLMNPNQDMNTNRGMEVGDPNNAVNPMQAAANRMLGIRKRPDERDLNRRGRGVERKEVEDKNKRERHEHNNRFVNNKPKDERNTPVIKTDPIEDGEPHPPNGVNNQQGMMFGGMGMPSMFSSGLMNNMGMVGGMGTGLPPNMGGMMMDPAIMGMGQFPIMQPQMDSGGLPDTTQMPNMQLPMPGNPLNIMGPGESLQLGNTEMPLNISGIMGMAMQANGVKDVIQFKSCSLVPPYPSSIPPTTRDRPPGCRTVFIGGLPENITEEILTEVFEKCGEILSLRLSKKNFCHIRFAYEHAVDGAVFLSGYRIRVDNKTDSANCGRLHVDYAQARDDQHEWECKQRALQREARHRDRMAVRRRAPSPPPIHHYTDHEATAICEKIKQDENFNQAVQVVITWLERGDCSKRNVNVFYSMIQSTNSHVRRLLNEKTTYEDELQRAKDETMAKMQGILTQFTQVEKVFSAASHKKVWDHFTKAQRKNIDMWKKQSSEIRSIQLEDFLQETCGADEMDVSDADDAEAVQRKRPKKVDADQLKEDNDSLRCQLEAYKNEIDILKSETKSEIDVKTRNITQLRERLALLETQLSEAKRLKATESVKLLAMEAKFHAKEKSWKVAQIEKKHEEEKRDDNQGSKNSEQDDQGDQVISLEIPENLSDKEAKLIGIISTFLHVHPFGASTDYIWSYVQKMEPYLRPNQVEELLRRFPTVYSQQISGVGANIERKWVFNGFN